MTEKLFGQMKKLAEKCGEQGKYKEADTVLMWAIDNQKIGIEQRQEAVMSLLTLNPHYTPEIDVSYSIESRKNFFARRGLS